MATPQQLEWLTSMFQAAHLAAVEDSEVPWHLTITPEEYAAAAACEAAVETGWGAHLPPNSNNVLGIKSFSGWQGKTVKADGTEQEENGTWTGPQLDPWCVFDSPQDCFNEQLMILCETRYAAAQDAPTVDSYILAECAVWSTGQAKGAMVLQIYHAHRDILSAPAQGINAA